MIKKVCQLLQHPRIERRCAAAMVLGELGDKAAAPALIGALSDGDPLVQLYALEALDRLGAGAQAAKQILPLLESHDDQVRTRAAAMLAGSGARAAEALRRELHPDTPIARRRTAVHVLAQQRSAAALDALLGAFADEALAEHALNALRAEIDGLEAKERKLIADRAEALLAQEKKHPRAAAYALRLLGYLGDPATVRSILAHAGGRHPPEVRAAALAALRRPLAHMHNGKREDIASKLLSFLDDEDATVAREALDTLQGLPLPDAAAKELLKLASSSRHADTRRFAVERVGQAEVGAREAAELVAKLDAPDAAVRDAAARSLARVEAAAVPLVKALLAADSADRIRRLTGILRAHAIKLSPPLRATLAERALALADAADPLAEPMLEVLRAADPSLYAERLAARADKLRKAKRWHDAWSALRPLVRAGVPLDENTRYLIAVVGLKASGKDLLRAARSTDPALAQLVALLGDGVPVGARLRKERDLEPDDLFYVGFNFVESSDPDEKDFGAELLEHLAESSPRSKLGKSARNKLKLAGVEV
ncbi:MAG TPA: HEAT repeat domain-containing protein [Polyangia bacterium]|nr:HEAT repeat domain-containing protein [Polyangia bacterium]